MGEENQFRTLILIKTFFGDFVFPHIRHAGITISHSLQMRVLLENTTFSIHKIIRKGGLFERGSYMRKYGISFVRENPVKKIYAIFVILALLAALWQVFIKFSWLYENFTRTHYSKVKDDSNADLGAIFRFLQNSPITKAVCTKISKKKFLHTL